MFRKLTRLGRKRSEGGSESLVPGSAPATREPSPSPSHGQISIGDGNIDDSELRIQRSPTATSNNTESSKLGEIDPGSLGLNVVYTPQNGHRADIVFIHGLGGTSKGTWSKSKDPELFWPLTFLALEPDICLARILTFGYNAAFRKASNISVSMLDFAKDLLFDLKFGQDQQKADLKMGNVPLIFVVHSMGGLILKEAYMQGQNDPEYAHIIKSIAAITFLATPHRGTNLAQTLNRILQSTMVTNSKQYVAEMAKNSLTLQKLNEQFRHIAPKLDIVSFYETLPTPIGLKNTRVMVLEKDSSVLGYPGETSKALQADHQNVCKYDSPHDPNYVAVRNILKSIISKIISTNRPAELARSTRQDSFNLKSLLGITQLPAIDYSFFRDQWVQGTSEWILNDVDFLDWRHDPQPVSRLLWLYGGPASGKSVMSTFIINKLMEETASCQYFFIRFGDRKKRTLGFILRSISYQIAQKIPAYLEKLLEFADEAVQLENATPRAIWERIFRSLLLNIESQTPIFWVIDGLDESEDPATLIKLLSELSSSHFPVRVLITSRDTPELKDCFSRIHPSLRPVSIEVAGRRNLDDFRSYVYKELHFSASTDYKSRITERILEGSQNNFLWVRLAVEKINLCRREADVERALQQLPAGMEALYDRMASSVVQHVSTTDREFAITILQYLTWSFRVLTIAELSCALSDDISGMFDLERSIIDLCAGFIVIDISGNVAMIHQTAREYLSKDDAQILRIDKGDSHKNIFLNCMRCLTTIGLRTKVSRKQEPEFLNYAATMWPAHLVAASDSSDEVGKTIKAFLTGSWVLTWIDYLARNGQLRDVIQASKHLSKYASRRKAFCQKGDESERIVEIELCESWSIDLIKVVGKFGNILRKSPDAIYKLIPPFCPENTSIWQCFGKAEAKQISISGFSDQTWDDSLARISLGDGAFATSIAAAGSQIAILTSSGDLHIHDASTFEPLPASPVSHKERLYRFQLNSSGSLIATYGYRTTKIWEVSTGKCKLSVKNLDSRPRPLAMLFVNNSKMLYVASDDRTIRSLALNESSPTWQTVASLEEPELEGHFLNASNFMTFNENGSMIAVAYRGHPLSAWETEGPTHIGHCWRKRDVVARGEVIDAAWVPHTPEVIGVYIEGVIFKWNPYTSATDELAVGASRMSMSRDGYVMATGDGKGTIKIFTTNTFSLLYQLASQDTVFDIAFSPDVCRFYDIRGNYASVWEPNALVKFVEDMSMPNDAQSDSDISSISISLGFYKHVDSITSIACSSGGKYYFSGTERGSIRLHGAKDGKTSQVYTSRSFLSIETIACSDDGSMVCFYDSGRQLRFLSILGNSDSDSPEATLTAEIPMQNVIKGPILQLLFHTKEAKMFVQASMSIHTVCLKTYKVTYSQDREATPRTFVCHPYDPSLIIEFENTQITVLDWDLQSISTYKYKTPFDSKESELSAYNDQITIDLVLLTPDKKHFLVQVSQQTANDTQKAFLYIETVQLSIPAAAITDSNQDHIHESLKQSILDRKMFSHILRPLSVLSRNRLIYLSTDFAICCWQLPSGLTKKLFYLPGDWISRDSLSLYSVWSVDKSLLCPRNGEIAVVRCSGFA